MQVNLDTKLILLNNNWAPKSKLHLECFSLVNFSTMEKWKKRDENEFQTHDLLLSMAVAVVRNSLSSHFFHFFIVEKFTKLNVINSTKYIECFIYIYISLIYLTCWNVCIRVEWWQRQGDFVEHCWIRFLKKKQYIYMEKSS